MKNSIYLIIAAIVILIYLFLDSPVEKSNQIKHSNIQPNIASQIDAKKTSKKIKDRPVKTNAILPLTEDDYQDLLSEKKENKTPELDYITAYRNYEYFANCFTDVEDFHNDKDPLLTLAERFENNPRESQSEPTPQQNVYYQHHVEVCKGLIENEKDDYYEIRRKLRTVLNNILPKTEEELQLKQALEMVQQFKELNVAHSRSFVGESSLSNENLNDLNSQIQDLSNQIMQIYENHVELLPEHVQQIDSLSENIQNLQSLISESTVPNQDKINQSMNNRTAHLMAMDDFLVGIKSADAFLVVATHLYQNDYYLKNSEFIHDFKQATGFNDMIYTNILSDLVLPLIACSMNYPCDPESDYILSLCLGLKDSMFNQACGIGLEDFYFNYYIGPNQLNDVISYFNYMVNRYAE